MAGGSASDSLTYCVSQLSQRTDPVGISRSLVAIRTKHIKGPDGIARFRTKGGLRPLLALLQASHARKALDLSLSILANCCTEGESRIEVRKLGGIPPLVTILKSLSVESIQNRTARALGNLAIDSENSNVIHEAGAVTYLVEVLRTSKNSECLQSVIRAIRNLADTAAHRQNITSQGAIKPIVEHLSSDDHNLVAASVRAVAQLTKACSIDCAEQLSVADGVSKLVSLVGHEKKAFHNGALTALGNICVLGFIRPTLGSAGGIKCFMDEIKSLPADQTSQLYIRALCFCCREAINRLRVREMGGLELLLSLLKDERYNFSHARIIAALLHFVYDEVAVEYLQSNGLIPLLVSKLVALVKIGKQGSRTVEEEEQEDERYAASCDFPTEYNRRPDPDQQNAESSSFQSLRSWLLSEGYIASPGDVSPQWSPESPEADGTTRAFSPVLQEETSCTARDLPLEEQTESRADLAGEQNHEDASIVPMEVSSVTELGNMRSPSTGLECDQPMDVSPDDASLEVNTSDLPFPSASESRVSETGQLLEHTSPIPESRTVFCRRRKIKSRSISVACDGPPNFAEALTSTPFTNRSSRSSIESISGDLVTGPLQEILSAADMPSLCSAPRQEEFWGPEAPVLFLLSRFSQVLDPSSLVTEHTLQGLLTYVTLATDPNLCCLRLLDRLSCNPNCLEAFIRISGVSCIRMRLIHGIHPGCLKESEEANVDCVASPGPEDGNKTHDFPMGIKWTGSKRLGESLIRNLTVQAESSFGSGVLNHMLLSGVEADRIACSVALPFICRKVSVCRKLLVDQGGLRSLLAFLVRSRDPLHVYMGLDSITALVGSPQELSTHLMSEGQIRDTICVTVSWADFATNPAKRAKIDAELLENISRNVGCIYQQLDPGGKMDVQFVLDSGHVVKAVRREVACSSDVFGAMLEGDYLEAQQTAVRICGVSDTAFTALMHFLHGCRRHSCPVMNELEKLSTNTDFENSVLQQTLSAASQFLLHELQSILEDIVCENYLNLDNMPAVYCFSELHNYSGLRVKCLKYLVKGRRSVLEKSRSLLQLIQATGNEQGLTDALHSVVLDSCIIFPAQVKF
ncbi:armadillo repeat-containing protein 5 [Protopterus annectens]|uniref:armadillo repeat-containing protein 5 n=1 Tax=Protopterus annectens TaxID=7888 RepID=UPI001CFAC9A5|nr:armadillo repeat-containing protein 5 [Protopterus annectens]